MLTRHKLDKAATNRPFRPKSAENGGSYRIKSQHCGRHTCTVWQLPYADDTGAWEGLRPTIQIEMTYAPLRQAPVTLPVSSFVAEAYGRPPEVAGIPCVSVTETAAEKLVALTRRIAMELAGLSRDPDPTLVRHIYDLHLMQGHIDPVQVGALARDIAAASDIVPFSPS